LEQVTYVVEDLRTVPVVAGRYRLATLPAVDSSSLRAPNGVVATPGSSLLTAPFNPKGVPYWQVETYSVSGNPFNVAADTVDSAYYHTSGGC